jgi:Uma2 family endonuclease
MDEIGGRRAVLCFPQMATKARITPDEYLHMSFECETEYVHGEIVERAMPTNMYSLIQFLILMEIGRLVQSHALFPRPELRLRLAPDLHRIPDTSVFAEQKPKDEAPSDPPLPMVEILSKDDRHHGLMEKLEEHRLWGVGNIWVVDPLLKRSAIYSETGLRYVQSLTLADYPLQLTPSALFSDL